MIKLIFESEDYPSELVFERRVCDLHRAVCDARKSPRMKNATLVRIERTY